MGWIWGKNLKHIIIVMVFLIFQIGCGSDGGGGDSGSGGDSSGGSTITLSALSISSAQDSVEPGNKLSLTITAYDKSGNTVKGIAVSLSVDEPSRGSVTPSVTTGGSGTAQIEFTARNLSGDVNITASSGEIEAKKKITILDQNAPSSIVLEANPTEILASKSSTITATVKDSLGNPVANGTTIRFSLKNTDFGSITSEDTTNAGKASVTFSAANKVGTAEIIASSGSATSTINVKINPVAAASVEFASVSQNPVAIKGSGGKEFSIIKFNVKDVNGNPADDTNVRFLVSGPGGAGYIEEDDNSPYEAIVSTVAGVASATFHSGYEAGTVTVTAQIDKDNDGSYDISAKTPVISIGGGVPSDKWFSVAAESWNLPGLATDGVETSVDVRLADRFGNFNILEGHRVSFRAGKGIAVDTTGAIDSKGHTKVTLRTQGGRPYYNNGDLTEAAWETSLRNTIKTEYNYDFGTAHPRLGWANLMTYTKGEEYFEDGSNGGNVNGLYNAGENFRDTIQEPFMDYNQSGAWNSGSGSDLDPYEDYVDVNNNNSHDGKNNFWDSDKYIFNNSYVVTSGGPIILFKTADKNYNIGNGGSKLFTVLVCDSNMNRISDGSTISFSIEGGKIVSEASITTASRDPRGYDSGSQKEIIEYQVVVGDEDVDENKAKPSTLICKVSWNNGKGTSTSSGVISGQVN